MEPVEESAGTAGGTTVEELERFRQDIERYRARRKAVSDEFDGFVQSFKKPAAATRPASPRVTGPLPAAPPVVQRQPAAPSAAQRPQTPAPVVEKPPAPAPVVRAAAASPPVPTAPAVPPAPRPVIQTTAPQPVIRPTSAGTAARQTRRAFPLLVLAALVMLVAVWLWTRDTGPAPDPATQPSVATRATAPVTAPAPTPPPQTPPAAPDRSAAELRTTRAVWIRATADGTRVVNRELPAGAEVPFRAEKTIEIRTGDAGAVRLWIGGRDQGPLGRDGQVVTRSFSVPVR